MKAGRGERQGLFIGVILALLGLVIVALAASGAAKGALTIVIYVLGAGLTLGGLIKAIVHFFRGRCIRHLLRDKNVLVSWQEGETRTAITTNCALVSGELHRWDTRGARLEGAQIYTRAERLTLRITIGEITKNRAATGMQLWRPRELVLQVPPEKAAAAHTAVATLQQRVAQKN